MSQPFTERLEVRKQHNDFRHFKSIRVRPKGELSIQASVYHYCTPRETYSDPKMYYTWEIAYITPKRGLVNPEWVFKDFPKNLAMVWSDGRNTVGAYVTTQKVQEILDWLEAKK